LRKVHDNLFDEFNFLCMHFTMELNQKKELNDVPHKRHCNNICGW
jgi:hypothetical protein